MNVILNSKNKIKCAVIGLGRIAWKLEKDPFREKPCTHVGSIIENPETHLVGCYDNDEAARGIFLKEFPAVPVYNSLEKLFDSHSVDILHIATHPDSHIRYLEEAVQNNVPVVVVEKPISEDLEATEKLLKSAEASGTRVIVNHERRFALDYKHVRSLVESKTYGSLLSVHSKLYMGRRIPLKDMLWHDGTHMLDIVRYMTQCEIDNLKASRDLTRGGVSSIITGELISRGSRASFSFDIGGGRKYLVFETVLSFERGEIIIGNGKYEEYKLEPSPYYKGARSLRRQYRFRFPKTKYFSAMIDEAVRCVKDPEVTSISDGYQGLATAKLITDLAANYQKKP